MKNPKYWKYLLYIVLHIYLEKIKKIKTDVLLERLKSQRLETTRNDGVVR